MQNDIIGTESLVRITMNTQVADYDENVNVIEMSHTKYILFIHNYRNKCSYTLA